MRSVFVSAVVALVAFIGLVGFVSACPTSEISSTGRTCKTDADCASLAPGAAEHHCEIALAQPTCLPGPPDVAGPKNLPPYATATAIVALVCPAGQSCPPQEGTLGVVDPEGAALTITSPSSLLLTLNSGATLAFDTATSLHYEFEPSATAGNELQTIKVTDGVNEVPITIVVVVIDPKQVAALPGVAGPSTTTKVAANNATFGDATAWTPLGVPADHDDILVNGALTVDAAVGNANRSVASAIVTKGATMTLDTDLRCNGANDGFFAGGAAILGTVTTTGDAKLVMVSGTATGALPATRSGFAFSFAGAATAASLDGFAVGVDAGSAVSVSGDVNIGSLSLSEAARVEVLGSLAVTDHVQLNKPADVDIEREVIVHRDVDLKEVRADDPNKAEWRLIVDGAGPHTVAVGGALDAVEIRAGADVTLSAASVTDLLLEGGLATPSSTLEVTTLHIRRAPDKLAGAGVIHAKTCDVPDVQINLAGIQCDTLE